MNFVDSRDMFGNGPTKEIPMLRAAGAPSASTAGAVGCLYMDTDSGAAYKCTAASDGTYTWVALIDKAEIQAIVDAYLEANPPSSDSGENVTLTTDQIDALHGMFKVCAYDDSKDIAGAYAAFKTAFGITDSGDSGDEETPDDTEKTLTGISAAYSGGSVAVGTAVTALTGVVVTATYDDGSTETVTGYTLSGSIAEGENTVTVTYQGMTATFTVTGVAQSGGEDATGYKDILTDYEWTDGIWLNANGVEITNAAYTSSEKIAFNGDDMVTCVFAIKNLKCSILCYAADDTFLGVVETAYSVVDENQTLTALENTAYIRSTMTIANRTSGNIQMLIAV